MRVLGKILVVLAAAGLAAGCYLPNDFNADLRITPSGAYNFQYQGLLVYLPLQQKLDGDGLAPAALTKQVEAVRQDLARDRGFKEITHLDRGTFRVRYKRVGDIAKEKSFNFVRFNARLLAIERHSDGTVQVFGDKPNTELAQQLDNNDYVMRGRLRIQTEADVSRHNADEVQEATAPIYVWSIDGLERPSPALAFPLRAP